MEGRNRDWLYAIGVAIWVGPMFAVGLGWFRPASGWFALACILTGAAFIGAAFLPGGAGSPGPGNDPLPPMGTIDLTVDPATVPPVAPGAPGGATVPVVLQVGSPDGGTASIPIVLEVRIVTSSTVLPPPVGDVIELDPPRPAATS